jgi:hypothetical protein
MRLVSQMPIASIGDFVSALRAELERLLSLSMYNADVLPVGKPFDYWYRGERDHTWILQGF